MALPIEAPSTGILFQQLSAAGVVAFVAERHGENLTLDFKLAPKNFESADGRKALARAVSGFANSSGGLLVWGVEAKRDADDVDCAQRAIQLAQLELFMPRLSMHSGAAVSPVVDGVRHRLVEGPDGPFVVTVVPESAAGPHMAKLGEDRYYKRSGDRFVRMEHFDVAEMFGRRRRPVLKVVLQKEGQGETVLVSIRNEGRGVAKAPYLSLDLPPGFRASGSGFDGNGSFGQRPVGRAHVRCFCFGSDATSVIHVSQELIVTKLEATVKTASGVPVLRGVQRCGLELAAEDIELTTGEWCLGVLARGGQHDLQPTAARARLNGRR